MPDAWVKSNILSVQFQISGSDFNSVNYICSSIYLSQFEITIAVKDRRVGERVACTDGNISVSFDGSCGRVDVCGYWTTTNGSISFNCSLDCTSLVIPCPAAPQGKPIPWCLHSHNYYCQFH